MTARNRKHHFQRYREIADILARHGLGVFVDAVGLDWLVPFHRGWFGHPRRIEPYTQAEHLRMALEELGPTFIKLGQILSTRADLLPPEYQDELAKLQDDAPAFPLADVHAVFRREFGTIPSNLCEAFDETPLAAASIGQAHAATLPGGKQVVVKVRRPGVVEQIETDLDILRSLAQRAQRNWQHADEYDLISLVDEFSDTLRAELDYVKEGRNAERISSNFSHVQGVHVPEIVWELTTSTVITLERVHGIKISNLELLDAAGIDRSQLAHRAADILLKMVFEDRFFHADPHPGNFFIESDGTIGLIDFGMVGMVDEPTQQILVNLLLAIVNRNTASLVEALIDLGVGRHHVDRRALERDLQRLLDRYYDAPLSDIHMSEIITNMQAIVRTHRLHLPANLALLLKTAIMAEGLGVMLDPSFRLAEALAPYSQRFVLQQYSPTNLAKRWARAGLDAAQLGGELPERLRHILVDLEQGRLLIELRPESFEPALDRLERLVNRLILSILVAAFIVGMAALLAVYRPPGWDAFAGVVFTLGMLIAIVLGLYLAWTILRSRGR